MSVLDSNKSKANDEAVRRANQIRTTSAQIADTIIRQWTAAWDTLWDAANPAAVLQELGSDAEELFELNDMLISFFRESLAGRRQDQLEDMLARVALKPATTINPDGTATIDE